VWWWDSWESLFCLERLDDWVVTVADIGDTCLKNGPKFFLAPFCRLHGMDEHGGLPALNGTASRERIWGC
jgi:hypothetical protein